MAGLYTLFQDFLPTDFPPEAFFAGVLLGLIGCLAYLLALARNRGFRFSLLDAVVLVLIMAASTAVAVSMVAPAAEQARRAALEQNWNTLRRQIELYKLDHGGKLPVLFRGGFPQMTQATNSQGIPGEPGPDFPHGPYLPGGIPENPFTGATFIVGVEQFPPRSATNVGGWLYHEKSGKIIPDLPEYVEAEKRRADRQKMHKS